MLNTDFVSRRYFLRIVVSAVFWIIHGSSAQEVKISCNVPSVRLHEDTFLTCFLPEDVGQTKKDFTVYKYRDTETPDAVLDCWWLSGILDCFVATGYRYDKQVSNKLSLKIPRVSSSHVGTYACQVASYPPDLINLCDLNIFSEGRSLCDIPSVKINSQTALTCYFPQDLRKTRTDFSVSHHSTPGVTETVLTCQWKADFLSCSVLSGYVFDNKVTSHLTLSIPKARKDHEGTYSCQTEGAVSLPFKNCSFSLKKETMSSCSVASVHEMESATLTCDFSADISLTRQNVHVIHFDGRENKSTNVLNCTWEKDQPFCLTAPGFEFNNTVTDHLVITIPRVTPDHNGTYVCDLQGVQFENFELCNFVVISASGVSLLTGSFIAVTVAAVIVMLIPLTLIIVIIILKHTSCVQQEKKVLGEEELMLSESTQEVDETTTNFLSFLSEEFRRIYPEYKTKSYLVPSLYININTNKSVKFAGKDMYVTHPPEERFLRYNMAMHRVLASLRLLAKHREEVMFVITQYNYDSYLDSLKQKFVEHKLPKLTESRKKDNRYGNFDVLVVHRKHGVLVGVVKTCREEADKKERNEMIDELIKGCKELDDAEEMIQHLLSDQRHKIHVNKLLILPNISQKVLCSVLNKNKHVEEIIGKCIGCVEAADLYHNCLCKDNLMGDKREQKIMDWFNHRFPQTGDSAFADDSQYVAILARFCGTATSWSLKIPGDRQSSMLPKTNADSVRMTGCLFNKQVLQPEQWDVLKEAKPLVFLEGPPASGKTRTLVLAGIRWMVEGHTVHVVSTRRESHAASRLINSELETFSIQKQRPSASRLVVFNDEDVNERVKRIVRLAGKGSLYILADEAGPCDTKNSPFNKFVKALNTKVSNFHLWAASCYPDIAPQCCQVHVFSNSFTCPPTILLQVEVMQLVSDCGIEPWNPDSRATAPTEGPPVKLVHHSNNDHHGNHPLDCETCSDEVEAYLQTLPICKEVDCSQMTDASFHLHFKDVMVLVESRINRNSPLCHALHQQGARVKLLDNGNVDPSQSIVQATNNEVVVAEVEHMFGVKKKIVIYVEGGPSESRMELNKQGTKEMKWNRLRGLTSATCQLIWVHGTS